jgi:hypothetical protein
MNTHPSRAGKSLRPSARYGRSLKDTLFADRNNFTDAQCKAVARFLRFIIEFDESRADEATVGAVRRWERFCNPQ